MEPGGEQSVVLTTAQVGIGSERRMTLAGTEIEGQARRVSPAERCLDIALILIALPFIVVIGAAIALAIYIDSPGSVIYRSWRIGRGGIPFAMLKFRKMRADAGSHPLTVADDERFTPIGRFLSATRLDELPQVWNVLRGEMRLVGPRPEVEYFVAEFAEEYGEILTVTPGITGVAQLRYVDEKSLLHGLDLLHGIDPADLYRDHVLPEKIKIDIAYARSRSLAGDLAILAQTVLLPFKLFASRLRARTSHVRIWLPTAAAAALLVLMFVVTSSHLS